MLYISSEFCVNTIVCTEKLAMLHRRHLQMFWSCSRVTIFADRVVWPFSSAVSDSKLSGMTPNTKAIYKWLGSLDASSLRHALQARVLMVSSMTRWESLVGILLEITFSSCVSFSYCPYFYSLFYSCHLYLTLSLCKSSWIID